MIVKVLIFFVHSYRWLISPYLQPRCRFQPTCSAYAVHALQHHGLKRGLYFIMRRLMRCHPFKSLGEAMAMIRYLILNLQLSESVHE